jgi:hypothetical protein
MHKGRRWPLPLFSAALLLFTVSTARAQVNLTIQNAGFEDPVQANNAFTTTGINGWTNSGESGVWRPVSAGFFSVPVPQGSQIGYTNAASVAQVLTNNLQVGQYALSAQVGRRNDGFVGDLSLELWAGGTVASGNVTAGTLLASGTLTVAQQTLGAFTGLNVPFTANAGNPQLGQTLAVRIVKLNGSQVDFDQINLSFTAGAASAAPEPASALLILSGLAVFARRRRH